MKKITLTTLMCILLTLCGCSNSQADDNVDIFSSEDETKTSYEDSSDPIFEYSEDSQEADNKAIYIDISEFLIDPYGYAGDEYIDYMKNTPVDIIVNKGINAASYQELDAAIQSGINIWREEIEYAIDELFKDVTDQALRDEFLEKQSDWEKYAMGEIGFDEKLIYSNNLGGYTVDFGLSYRYMILCRDRALHIKYLHYMLECANEDRTPDNYLSMKFKNA